MPLPFSTFGQVVKLGEGHYRIVHDEEERRSLPHRKPNEIVVDVTKQDPTKQYCATCSKRLNKNNRTGWCRKCAEKIPRKDWYG